MKLDRLINQKKANTTEEQMTTDSLVKNRICF